MDFFQLMIAWVGAPAAILVVGGGLIWWHWDKIKKAPGVASVLQWLTEGNPLPRASGKHFAVTLAQLENDPQGEHRFLIREALNRISGIEVILIDRTISLAGLANQEDAKRAAHDRARTLLKETNAQVMIWGSALEANNVTAPQESVIMAGITLPTRVKSVWSCNPTFPGMISPWEAYTWSRVVYDRHLQPPPLPHRSSVRLQYRAR